MNYLNKKINEFFPGLVVRKDLVKLVKGNAIVPSYVLEYLLGQYCATSDEESITTGIQTVQEILQKHFVHRSESELIKSTIREKGRHKVIDKIVVELNDKNDTYEAKFSNLGIKNVLVTRDTIKVHPKLLVGGVWCIADMEYDYKEDKRICPWIMTEIKPIQMSHSPIDEYIEQRVNFKTDEWIDLLIQSVGFNPEMMDRRAKLHQLVRLVPFCERNYNLIELGPKGTGKSHIYSEFSPHGMLLSGGEVTVAKLFVNNSNGKIGLVGFWDTVAFDEFAGKKKRANKALVDILKNYMANKSFSRGIETLGAEASMAFVGNTQENVEHMLMHSDLFDALPEQYHDSAFLDRLHFYIPGWEVEVIRGELFTDGYGFVVDYLAEILRKLRDQDFSNQYAEYYQLSSDISTRDRDGINKTFSGLFKILYPHQKATKEEIGEILGFAIEGRKRIKDQLLRIDSTYPAVDFGYSINESGETVKIKTREEEENSDHYYSRPNKQTAGNNKAMEEESTTDEEDCLDPEAKEITDIISGGENKTVEFKSTVRWDLHQNKVNKDLEYDIVKAIAAFANTDGGCLIIGVNDSGEIVGLENDYKTLGKKQNADGFLLHLDNIISRDLGTVMTAHYEGKIIAIKNKQICMVNVTMCAGPVYVNDNDFYIRSAASSRQLTTKEANSYIKERWG